MIKKKTRETADEGVHTVVWHMYVHTYIRTCSMLLLFLATTTITYVHMYVSKLEEIEDRTQDYGGCNEKD